MPKINVPFEKILLINIFGIGDVLFTTPLIANIRESLPHVFIGFVCNKRTTPLLRANSKINKIFIYEKDEYRKLSRQSPWAAFKKFFLFLGEIKKENFDVALDLSLNKYSSFLLWWLGIKKRIGFNYKNRSPLLTTKIKIDGYEGKHVVEYYLSLLKTLGLQTTHKDLEIFISPEEKKWVEDILKRHNISSKDFCVGVVPGGGASWGKDAVFKRWPAKNFALFCDKMIEKFSAKIILMGDQNEKELCDRVVNLMHQKVVGVFCEMTVNQFAAFLKRCSLAVVNDGGPLHVAVAVGVKTVSIFGPVDEHVYGPYPGGGQHGVATYDIPCRPCYRRFRIADCEHHNCVNLLNVDHVLEKVEEHL